MRLPDWSRPGESRAHTVALGLAFALPLLVHAAFEWNAPVAAALWLALPIIAVSFLGGLGPGLLATAVAVAVPLIHWARTDIVDHPFIIGLALLGVSASVAFEVWIRASRRSAASLQALQQASDFHLAAAELSADFAWRGTIVDEVLLVDAATPGFIAAVGMTLQQLNKSGGIGALVAADDKAAFVTACKRVAAGQAASCEWTSNLAGRAVRYHADMQPFQQANVTGVIGAMRDVTEHFELTQQLRERNERHEATVLATGLIFFDYDTGADRLSVDGDSQRMLGEWPSQLGGPLAEWLRRLHPDDVQSFVSEHQAALRDRRQFRLTYRLRHAAGHFVSVEHSGRLDDSGTTPRMIGFLRDVTQEQQIAATLREREMQQQAASATLGEMQTALRRQALPLQALAAVAPVGIALATGRDAWLANAALGRLLFRERVSDEPLAALADGDEPCILKGGRELAEDELPLQRAARTLQPVIAEELKLQWRDGRNRELVASAMPIVDDGELLGCIGVFVDISEQRRLDAELQRRTDELRTMDQRKDEFLATLAHELRNPLAPIRNASMLLGVQEGSPQGIDWIRRVIDRQTDHLARLIDDLLDVSRITRDQLRLRLERVALDQVLDAAVDSVRSQADAQRHQLAVDLERGLWLQGDRVRLTQIFTNLLSNAVKYTSPGGQIQVRAAAEGDGMIAVSVRDNGIGIAPEQVPQLFEMFYQVDRSIERSNAGLGIGLTLVDRLVRLHGGTVHASSAGIGRGAEFVVRLPVADEPARQETRASAPSRGVRGLRILVADDSVDSALTLTALLAAAGHEVQAVHDGFAALHRAAEFRPQVLVLDIGMPGLNGYDTCRRIRAEPWGRSAIIIAVTGWGTDDDRRRSREAGFDAHLVKPVDYAELQKHFSLDNSPLVGR